MYYALKQRSLEQLIRAVADPERRAETATVMTALVLLELECFENGARGWSVHLEGAKRLIEASMVNRRTRTLNHLNGYIDLLAE